jgi:pSer/pThr/pTyr-binding forkhead associated (FHA) protein
MATLRNVADGREVPVSAQVRVGRARDAGLRLEHPLVSTEHALIRFSEEGWEVKDLGSRNGTIVDGVSVPAGTSARVDIGSHIVFGDDAETWEMVDAEAPGLLAISLADGRVVRGKDGMLVLPDRDAPECSVYRRGEFVLERDEKVEPIADGDVITVGGEQLRVQLPMTVEGTPLHAAQLALATARFRFKVSRDEETVVIEVLHRGRTIVLDSHWHGYVLLTLARLRLAGDGWVTRDRLLKMLRMDVNGLNVAIHKAREQLLAAGIEDAAAIVEVRRGQRRFGTDRFEVLPLE